jgi:hypothetical protein
MFHEAAVYGAGLIACKEAAHQSLCCAMGSTHCCTTAYVSHNGADGRAASAADHTTLGGAARHFSALMVVQAVGFGLLHAGGNRSLWITGAGWVGVDDWALSGAASKQKKGDDYNALSLGCLAFHAAYFDVPAGITPQA